MHPFRAAIEARDLDAVTSLLADDVVFRSPIVFRALPGDSRRARNPGGGRSRV